MSKRLGQEETYAKELSIINNKLQNNMHTIRDIKEVREENKNVYHFYPGQSNYQDEDDEDSDEISKRKMAWAELERE